MSVALTPHRLQCYSKLYTKVCLGTVEILSASPYTTMGSDVSYFYVTCNSYIFLNTLEIFIFTKSTEWQRLCLHMCVSVILSTIFNIRHQKLKCHNIAQIFFLKFSVIYSKSQTNQVPSFHKTTVHL